MSLFSPPRCYGGGQSLRAWQRGRLASSLETKATAKQRRDKLDLDCPPQQQKCAKKSHIGNKENMTWDKDGLKAEVQGYGENQAVCWSELAKRYNVCNSAGQLASNGGQMVKDYLISEGIDVSKFQTKDRTKEVLRRRKRKALGGEISIPTEVHPVVLKKQLLDKLQSGEYTIGEMIVPRKVCYHGIKGNLLIKYLLRSVGKLLFATLLGNI